MHVTLCSIFRNSSHYLDRYFDQIAALRKEIDVRHVGTWGDSSDDTYARLLALGPSMELGTFHHGGPEFGSVDHGPRWDQIARVVRRTLASVGDPGDALIWVEADLIWEPDTIVALLNDLRRDVPAVAPMVFAADSPRFYDIWGFRKNGVMFDAYPPYYTEGLLDFGLVKIDSCGSCWVTNGDAWRDWSGHWPYPAGGCLWLDPKVSVTHP